MIKLEKFTSNDFERLISWVDNEELLMQFGGPLFIFPLTIDQLQEYINDAYRMVFRVIEYPDEIVVGHAELVASDNETMKVCRILIGDISKRGKGLGHLIICELLKLTFLNLGYEKAELNVYDWNLSAIRCYEKNGFIMNPEKISNVVVKGNSWTAINMIVIKKDWLKLNE